MDLHRMIAFREYRALYKGNNDLSGNLPSELSHFPRNLQNISQDLNKEAINERPFSNIVETYIQTVNLSLFYQRLKPLDNIGKTEKQK